MIMLFVFIALALAIFPLVVFDVPAIFYFLILYSPIRQFLPESLPYHEATILLRFVALFGTIVSYLLRKMRFQSLLFIDKLSTILLVWFCEIVLSTAVSRNYYDWAFRAILMIASILALYYCLRAWLRNEQKVRNASLLLSGVVLISGLLAIVQTLVGGYTQFVTLLRGADIEGLTWEGRAAGFSSGGPNGFSGLMNMYLPFSIALAWQSRDRKMRIFHILSSALGSLGIILSGSRGAAAALVLTVVLSIVYFVRNKRIRWTVTIAFVILVPIITLIAASLSPRLTDVDQAESVLERYLLWDQAYTLYKSHPLTGIGLGNFREMYDPNMVNSDNGRLDVHNLYLQLLCETGVIGLLVFLTLCGYVIKRAINNLKRVPRDNVLYCVSFAACAGVLSILIHGAVDFLFLSGPEFGAGFAVMLALFGAAEFHKQKNLPSTSAAGGV